MLPPNASFNHSSLQAYQDCRRRFWLAYIEQLPWPAVEAAPTGEYETLSERGKRFHRLVERTELGMKPDDVAAQIDLLHEPDLAAQYDAYQTHRPSDLPDAVREVELMLSASLPLDDAAGGDTPVVRLVAQYDLLAADVRGRAVIVDWKTGRRVPTKPIIQENMQSILYPFVLVEASSGLPWGPIRPEQVEMRYWFTAAPERPLLFLYDGVQHDRTRARLRHLIQTIQKGEVEADFPKVEDTPANRRRFCAFCVYRSRCDRGVQAGDVAEIVDPTDFFSGDVGGSLEFTLDTVEELAF